MSDDKVNKILQIPIDAYNIANNTKWIFNIPVGYLFHRQTPGPEGQILEYPLNCKSVQFPDFKIGTTSTAFLSYGFDVSTRQNITEKGLIIEFLVSSNWLQYLMLLKWFELSDYTRYTETRDQLTEVEIGGIKRNINTVEYQEWMAQTGQDPYYSTQGPIVTTNLYLMDNFMNRIATFNFEGCFLTDIKNVDLDYSKTESTEIITTFTLSFYKYNVFVNTNELRHFIPDGGLYLDDHDKNLIRDD